MSRKILITTSDYTPKIGGLTTFTLNIESCLKALGFEVDIFVWNSLLDCQKINSESFEYIFNINSLVSRFIKHERQVNFYHGSEILFYSPNLIKNLTKKVFKSTFINAMESSYKNIFISEFTLKTLEGQGFKTNYERDIVFHNCIDTQESIFLKKELGETLEFVCIARDVPHKNLDGAISICEQFHDVLKKRVVLHLVSERFLDSNKVKIERHEELSDELREELYKRSHFNLLMSLDYSKTGFFEGFGLTVLEAGKYGTPTITTGTGGLSESVHHGKTGWIVGQLSNLEETIKNYEIVSAEVYKHTLDSHNLGQYEKLFRGIL